MLNLDRLTLKTLDNEFNSLDSMMIKILKNSNLNDSFIVH